MTSKVQAEITKGSFCRIMANSSSCNLITLVVLLFIFIEDSVIVSRMAHAITVKKNSKLHLGSPLKLLISLKGKVSFSILLAYIIF